MSDLLTVHVGDAMDSLLNHVPAGSCQVCVTSPPYWGLRNYKVKGQIGVEPTPQEYVFNILATMAAVRTCLKDDGLLWLNLGDSYAAQRGGTQMPAETMAGGESGKGDEDSHRGHVSEGTIAHRNAAAIGLKHKDLVMIPSRVAMAMQADGWTLRSMIPWIKRNPMPESVEDRPATAVEYVFMFSKSDRYYYDYESVKMPYSESFLSDGRHITGSTDENEKDGYDEAKAQNPKKLHKMFDKGITKNEQSGLRRYEGMNDRWYDWPIGVGRRRRNSDWFFESWQGLMHDEDGDPMALVVNTHGFKGAHFATWPEKLVRPMILASTKPGDTVLDPFFGAGTTGLVALKLGRKAIGCELNPEFAKMAEERCSNEMMKHLL